MIERKILVGETEMPFRASAAIPRLYRFKFRRDIFADLSKLEGTPLMAGDGTGMAIIEDIAYIMAKHADPAIPNAVEEWLEGFDMMALYFAAPEILMLWQENNETLVQSKKNLTRVAGK